MLNDPQTIVGLVFLASLLLIITVFWVSKIFKDKPYFQIGLIFGEISFIMLVTMNPWWLHIISFVFALMIIVLTFLSGLILSRQTIMIGLPSIMLFVCSLFFGRGELWVAVLTSLVFVLGLVLSLREMQTGFEMLGRLFPIFAFSLAIVGVFLIPTVFQQMDFLNGMAEIAGTAAGSILCLRARH
jgi:hypothetical protein